jgi:hypothetical protein
MPSSNNVETMFVQQLAHDDSFLSPNVDIASDDVSADDPDTPPSILDHFLSANFAKASFLTPPMIKYHRNEYDRPGYGLACIVSNAFQITKMFLNYHPRRLGSILICVASVLLLHERIGRALA